MVLVLRSAGCCARQFGGLVVELTASGQEELQNLGRRHVGQAIKKALGGKLDPIAVPKKIRYVDVIPVNPQGKREPAVLRASFD